MLDVRGRTPEELEAARLMLLPFVRAGYQLFPLAKGTKIPRDKGWQDRTYSFADIGRWLVQGGNVGIRLRDIDLVLDVDPRHFNPGDKPLKRLSTDVGFDLGGAPTVLTGRGDGGLHLYYRKPALHRIVGGLDGFKGIDFRSIGALIVAPGSVHPDTGQLYLPDEFAPPISAVTEAPAALLALLERPAIVPSANVAGRISNERLAELLGALDPRKFRAYDSWIRLAASCHDATAGGGMAEFLTWCAGDPQYADQESWERNSRHWQSFTAGKSGGATYKTLLKVVVDAGRRDLVATLGDDDDAEDFADFDAEVVEDPASATTADVIDPVDRDAPVIDLIDPNAEIEDAP